MFAGMELRDKQQIYEYGLGPGCTFWLLLTERKKDVKNYL